MTKRKPRKMMAAGVAAKSIAVTLWLLPLTAPASELLNFEFARAGGRYSVQSAAYIDVPPAGVYAVLTDYQGLHRISNLVVKSAELEPDAQGRRRVYTLNKGCLALFCRSVEKTEYLQATPHSLVETIVIKELSDVAHSHSAWRLKPEGRGTRLDYEVETEINFWVPPVIGNYLLSRWLQKGADQALQRIEYYAWQALYGREPQAPAPAADPDNPATDDR